MHCPLEYTEDVAREVCIPGLGGVQHRQVVERVVLLQDAAQVHSGWRGMGSSADVVIAAAAAMGEEDMLQVELTRVGINVIAAAHPVRVTRQSPLAAACCCCWCPSSVIPGQVIAPPDHKDKVQPGAGEGPSAEPSLADDHASRVPLVEVCRGGEAHICSIALRRSGGCPCAGGERTTSLRMKVEGEGNSGPTQRHPCLASYEDCLHHWRVAGDGPTGGTPSAHMGVCASWRGILWQQCCKSK